MKELKNTMLPKELLIKRLVLIKQLYKIGYEQSYQNESVSVFSVLAFHDSVEMFLKLLAEHKEIDSAQFRFFQYWTHIPDLTQKETMRNLNNRRRNIKHAGLLPAKSEIESSRVNTTDFFEENTKAQFGLDFSDISLVDLISYNSVKEFLVKSEKAFKDKQMESCIENTAYAFDELLHVYSNNKSDWGSPFFFGKSMTWNTSFSLGINRYDSSDEIKKIGKFIDDASKTLEELQKVTKILSLGIDYREYVKFQILTPFVQRTLGGKQIAHMHRERNWNVENCQFCIDFVIKSALKLQGFDFDIQELHPETFEVKVENLKK